MTPPISADEMVCVTRTGTQRGLTREDLESLSEGFSGTIQTPESDEYEAACRVWNGTIERKPSLVARCASEDDVARVVTFAAARDLEVRIRAGGHNVAGTAISDGSLLIDLGRMRTVEMPYCEAQQALDEDYPDGKRYYWKSLYFDELEDDVVQLIHDAGKRRPSPESTLDIWVLGGAISDVDENTSSFPQRHANYMVAIEANWTSEADDEPSIDWARTTFEALRPHSTGAVYLNFPGSDQERLDAVNDAHGPVMNRLRAVQRRLDPKGLFSERL